MKITVLGTAGSYPGYGQACSGYLIQEGKQRLLIDLGAGSLTNVPPRIGLDGLEAVLISHMHPDHYSDIFVLSIFLEFFSNHSARMPLYAPPGSDETLKCQAWKHTKPFDQIFDFRPWQEKTQHEIGPFVVEAARTTHMEPTFALRISGPSGQTVAYSSDTGPSDQVEELAHRADLLIAEASWDKAPSADEVGHLTPEQAGTLAASADAGRLILTHFLPEVDLDSAAVRAGQHFKGPVLIADVGQTYEVRNPGGKRE